MNNVLVSKIKDAIFSVIPICLIVLLLHFTIVPLPYGGLALFFVGLVLFILGLVLFNIGADVSMMEIGESIGSYLTRSKKLLFILFICFLIGFITTVAEPDVKVLASQVSLLPVWLFVVCISLGDGAFLVLALLRSVLKIKIRSVLLFLYAIIFLVALFVSEQYIALGFDASGVTTGSITVPLVLALGAGLVAVRGDKGSRDDSFGLFAICSLGPTLLVLIAGLFSGSPTDSYIVAQMPVFTNLKEVYILFLDDLLFVAKDVFYALLPIVVFFIIFQFLFLKLSKKKIVKILLGIVYTFLGIVLFLVSVEVVFMPIGNYVGKMVGEFGNEWLLLFLSAIIGLFIVAAEPAVQVLNRQVEDVTGGAISRKVMLIAISIGVSLSLVLSMLRIIYEINIWWFVLPGFGFALFLSFLVPDIFTAIAFDSGGIASGTMAGAFLLPFSIGVCGAIGKDPLSYAFGIIALIAMMPTVAIQVVGLIYKMRLLHTDNEFVDTISEDELELTGEDTEIIDLKE